MAAAVMGEPNLLRMQMMMMRKQFVLFARRPREQQRTRPGHRILLLLSTRRHGCCRKKNFPRAITAAHYLAGRIIVGAPFDPDGVANLASRTFCLHSISKTCHYKGIIM
jgi:hypothetical protein